MGEYWLNDKIEFSESDIVCKVIVQNDFCLCVNVLYLPQLVLVQWVVLHGLIDNKYRLLFVAIR